MLYTPFPEHHIIILSFYVYAFFILLPEKKMGYFSKNLLGDHYDEILEACTQIFTAVDQL